ncbi:MAG: 4Fe-4S dicluster domain-containing protein [Gemmatimonadetes bacterium]|nr:4Fe-4S dicluster domain-containing protein [Gemmatimonadota bacterium]
MTFETGSAGVKRRAFLKVLGATGAASTLVGCDTDGIQHLIPYVVSPDQTVPGVSNYYASTCRECAAACGILVETRDGRAIKVEGNPAHPVNKGALCGRGQAALQGLYNPDRFRSPMMREGTALKATTWERAMAAFTQKLGEAKARGDAAKAVFLNQHEIGSFPAFLDQWLAAYGMPAHYSVDAEADLPSIAAHKQVYGVAWPMFDFGKAALVVSFGADFLDHWGMSVPQQLSWADARARADKAPRFVYVGARRSLTGLNADEWIAAKPGSEAQVVAFLRGATSATAAAAAAGVPEAQLTRLAAGLKAAKPSLLLAGGFGAMATELCVAVAELNKSLGNVGVTVRPAEGATGFDRVAGAADLRDLADRMKAGGVPMIMVRGANPAYAMPKASGFAEAFAKVPFKVSFSSYPDETTELCDLVLPDHHPLEQWGDADATAAMVSLQQPAMEPVFETRATSDVLIAAAQADAASAARYPQKDYRSWLVSRFPGGAAAFGKALAKGVVAGKPALAGPAGRSGAAARAPAAGGSGDFTLVVFPSPVLGDGRGANKPWLQELPDPVSKVCWQSWIEIHPLTARRMGVQGGDHLTVTTAAGSVTAPAWPYLGVREDVVAVALGQGHTSYGRYARGVGVNALDAIGAGEDRSGSLVLSGLKCTVGRAAGHSDLVTTEGSARQHGRGIAQAVAAADVGKLEKVSLREEPMEAKAGEAAPAGEHAAARGVTPLVGPFGGENRVAGNPDTRFGKGLRSPVAADAQGQLADLQSKDKGMYAADHPLGMAKRRWAMTIDLARCTGCSACVTACYAENNIPTVGAPWQGRTLNPMGGYDDRPGANILKGREMAWLRLERYFEGGEAGEADFEARFVPMMCQHCGNAPCEPVCPVYATYHAPDGLNVQVYNRCVGTRYCSNNCPYKVRYFNWFGFGEPDRRQYAFPEPLNWQLNPDVTVRGKGVMEKCTFCVQRIREAEHRAALDHKPLEGDSFTVACAQACPSRAITFGDAADDSWSVAKLAADPRGYHVLEELNTYSAVVYLRKVNHPGAGQATAAAGEH